MKNIKIIACYHTSWWAIVSKLIRWAQKTDFSHFAIEYDGNIYDSTGTGVCVKSKKDFLKHYQSVMEWTTEINESPVSWFNDELGTRYGFLQIAGLYLKSIKVINNNPFTRGIVCNELVLMFMKQFCNAEIGDVNNYDLVQTIEEINKIETIKLIK